MSHPENLEHQRVLSDLAKQFVQRAKTQGWNPEHAVYRKHALEFFIGAIAMQEALGLKTMGTAFMILLVTGTDPAVFIKPEAELQS